MYGNYSSAIQKAFRQKKIEVGDRISVDGKEGVLMPKSAGNPDVIVLKLDNGYNVGVKAGKIKLVKKYASKKAARVLAFDKSKPHVSIITTGGTIMSKVDYHTGGVKSLVNANELLLNVPELAEIVNVRSILSPFNKMSEDMEFDDWKILARLAAAELNKDNRGIIVTHGTDILAFTAAALSFMLKNLTKPVVLVGAQRSVDRGSSDTAMNLICASHATLSDMAEVGICMHGTMNDDYCIFSRGTKVRKMHTSRRDAFRPINELPIAKIWPSGSIEITNDNYRKRSEGRVEADTKFEENIAMLKFYPGSEPSVMDYLVKKGCRGFVVEATALGHVAVNSKRSWIPHIKSAVDRGIPVAIASQSLYGRVNPYVYTNLRLLSNTGAIFVEDMLPETAYIKLGFVLGHTKKMDDIRRMMLANMAGELTERIDPRAFLC